MVYLYKWKLFNRPKEWTMDTSKISLILRNDRTRPNEKSTHCIRELLWSVGMCIMEKLGTEIKMWGYANQRSFISNLHECFKVPQMILLTWDFRKQKLLYRDRKQINCKREKKGAGKRNYWQEAYKALRVEGYIHYLDCS